ncbi:hypothetical protein LPJ56_002697 [Coemansia sp. RSA 2599]|nr:hypothetical protein LPJ56_002697 [Coemansia sp. RSA 2599]
MFVADVGYNSDSSCQKHRRNSLDLVPELRRLKEVGRSASVKYRKRLSTLHSIAALPQRQSERTQASRERHGEREHKIPTITRVDATPQLSTSIPALEVLFEQYKQNADRPAGDAIGPACGADGAVSSVLSKSLGSSSDLSASSGGAGLRISVGTMRIEEVDECMSSSPTLTSRSDETAVHSRTSEDSQEPDLKHEPVICIDNLLDSLFPSLPPNAKPYHTYFNVATVDGVPTIPDAYVCPTSMCTAKFQYFEGLQTHWSEHPWNRRGILVPVTAGGIRRLSFWQHKARFVRSVLHGPHVAELPGQQPCARPLSRHRRSLWKAVLSKNAEALPIDTSCSSDALDAIQTSDFGDIRFWGPHSYFVSPRVLPLEQVRAWEATRDKRNGAQTLS